MILGAALLAGAVNLFFKPMAIFAGGVPGLAIVVVNYLGPHYGDYLGVIILLISLLFFVVQFYFLGRRKVLKGVITTLTFTALVQLSTGWTNDILISQNLILMALGGSILAGAGISLILSNGYSFIGTVGLAEIITRRFEIPPGKSVMYVESVVILLGLVVIGPEQAMISALGIYVLSKTVHSLTFGMYSYKKLLIISPELERIREHLTREVCSDSSIIPAINAARGERQDLLMIVMRYDQFRTARDIIRQYDPHAFVIATDVTEIMGEGFRTL